LVSPLALIPPALLPVPRLGSRLLATTRVLIGPFFHLTLLIDLTVGPSNESRQRFINERAMPNDTNQRRR